MAGTTQLLAILLHSPVSVTVGTGDLLLNLQTLLDALIDLFERKAYPRTQVGTSEHLTTATCATAKAAETTEIKASSAEEVTKAAKDVLHRHPTAKASSTATSSTAADTSVAKLIVALSLLGVT